MYLGDMTTQVEERTIIDDLQDQIAILRDDIYSSLDEKKNLQAEIDVTGLKAMMSKEKYRTKIMSLANDIPAFFNNITSLPEDERMEVYIRLNIFLHFTYPLDDSGMKRYYEGEMVHAGDFLLPYSETNSKYNSINAANHYQVDKASFLEKMNEDVIPNFIDIIQEDYISKSLDASKPVQGHNYYKGFNVFRSSAFFSNSSGYYEGSQTHPLHNHNSNKININPYKQILSSRISDETLNELYKTARFYTYIDNDELDGLNDYIVGSSIMYPLFEKTNIRYFNNGSWTNLFSYEPFNSSVNILSSKLDYRRSDISDEEKASTVKAEYKKYLPLIKQWFDYYFNEIIPLALDWYSADRDIKEKLVDMESQDNIINSIKSRITGTINTLRSAFPSEDFPTLEDILKDYEARSRVNLIDESVSEEGEVLVDLEVPVVEEQELSEETKDLANVGKSNKGVLIGGAAALAAYLLLG